MTKAKNGSATPVVRTSAGLRDAIFDEMDAIRNGDSNPTRANAVAKLAGSIVDTVQMELDVQKHLRTVATGPKVIDDQHGLGQPLSLGVPE